MRRVNRGEKRSEQRIRKSRVEERRDERIAESGQRSEDI